MPQAEPGFSSVCVIGLGYVGLPTAVIFARSGLDVLGVDIDEDTVALINDGRVHIVEPDLDDAVRDAVKSGKLSAALEPAAADAFIIAVPTPFKDDHQPDLAHVEAAARALAPVLKRGDLVIVESTSPVGATERVSEWLAELRADLAFPHDSGDAADVRIAHSPERVLPGRVMVELVDNDRVVGGVSRACAERAAAFYELAVDGACLLTDARTAELVKLAENAYRDVNIAFANELSMVCDRLGIDPWETVELANHHPRVNVLQPGPGVGGHCIAVDPWFIVDSAPELTPLIRAARQVNDAKPKHVAAKVREAAAAFETPSVACLGLAYKADIDDLRESPAVAIVAELAADANQPVLVVEPHVDALPAELAGLAAVELCDLEAALERADVVVLLTDHAAFREVDRGCLDGKTVIDSRGLWRHSGG